MAPAVTPEEQSNPPRPDHEVGAVVRLQALQRASHLSRMLGPAVSAGAWPRVRELAVRLELVAAAALLSEAEAQRDVDTVHVLEMAALDAARRRAA